MIASTMRRAPHIISRINGAPWSARITTPPTKRYYADAKSSHPRSSTGTGRSRLHLTVGSAGALLLSGFAYAYGFLGDGTKGLTKSLSMSAPHPGLLEIQAQASKPAVDISSMIPTTPTELAAEILKQHVCRAVRNQANEATLLLSPGQCSQILRANEESFQVARGKGVVRYDRTQVASNDPIEDDYSENLLERFDRDWIFWGIYDGHAGFATSAKLRQALIAYVYAELDAAHRTSTSVPDAKSIDKAIASAFLKLDEQIVHQSVEIITAANSRRLASHLLSPAISGSCALLSFYDTSTQLFRVACTGDSRAVLGRKDASGLWTATALSADQTGNNPEEADRIRREHPGEKDVIKNGRIFDGIQPTRTFGDASYKWTKEKSLALRKRFWANSPKKQISSPPYLTAEPIVTTTKIEPENGDFVVMASDALWEMLSNEEVIGLVSKWIESEHGMNEQAPTKGWYEYFLGSSPYKLPVGGPFAGQIDRDLDADIAPHRPRQWGMKRNLSRFVVEDENAATHLARNAYGGNDADLMAGLLALPTPNSRRFRDDLTITVIFFGSDRRRSQDSFAEKAGNEDFLKAKL